MKVASDQLFTLSRLHEILISRRTSFLLDTIAGSLGLNPYEVKRLLSQLEKLRAIRNLRFAGNAFSFELAMHKAITANVLVEDYGFSVVTPEEDINEAAPKADRIKELQTQNETLIKKITKLERDLECYAKHGKPHDRIVESALVDHGD